MDRKQKWRKRARYLLAQAFGDKCCICGYNGCIEAMDYHHVGGEKDSALSIGMRNGYSWQKIVAEARKCTLVCCRCHRELHAGLIALPSNYPRFDEFYANILDAKTKQFNECPVCGNPKWVGRTTCSTFCRDTKQMKLPAENDELISLRRDMTYAEIGARYGVTEAAVRKRLKARLTKLG